MPFKIYINPPNRRISRIFRFFSGGSAVIILNGPFGKPCRPPHREPTETLTGGTIPLGGCPEMPSFPGGTTDRAQTAKPLYKTAILGNRKGWETLWSRPPAPPFGTASEKPS
jgi:hypothetical protein